MIISARCLGRVLTLLVLLGWVNPTLARGWGQSLDVDEPSPLFTGKSIPEPPLQKAKWTPPTTTVPKEFVEATALLFADGLADPRGCEYREIYVTSGTGGTGTGDGGVQLTHGWVLPSKEGENQRFAICWNGLAYPLVNIGAKADLQADVNISLKHCATLLAPADIPFYPNPDGGLWEGSHLRDLATALLLRLGEGEKASGLWAANHPVQEEGVVAEAGTTENQYLRLAYTFAWNQFDRALSAHMRSDDSVALYGFRRLAPFAVKVQAFAKKRTNKPPKEREDYLPFVSQVPDLLADHERRAREGKREPVVCIGPGRIADQTKRISALIARLDEVNARQPGQPGGVSLNRDPIVAALIREGEPALEPLLKCFEEDRRMTRSVHYWRDFSPTRTCLGVHEAAYVALSGILGQWDYKPECSGCDLTVGGDARRNKLVPLLRDEVKTAKRIPIPQRLFNVLADDKAGPEKWLDSAKALMTPEGELFEPTRMSFSYGRIANNKIKVVAEPLRAKKDPTLTELLLKRIEQGTEFTQSAHLALLLAEWDPKASLKHLADLMTRIRDQDGDSKYLQVLRDTAKNIESPSNRLVEEKQDRRHWLNFGSGFDASANFAISPGESFDNHPPRLSAKAALLVAITLRNSAKVDQDSQALEQCVRLRLFYSEEMITPQGIFAPKVLNESKWTELQAKPDARFKAETARKLAPSAEMKWAAIDLRQWFDMSKPGFYRLALLSAKNPTDAKPGHPMELTFTVAPPKP